MWIQLRTYTCHCSDRGVKLRIQLLINYILCLIRSIFNWPRKCLLVTKYKWSINTSKGMKAVGLLRGRKEIVTELQKMLRQSLGGLWWWVGPSELSCFNVRWLDLDTYQSEDVDCMGGRGHRLGWGRSRWLRTIPQERPVESFQLPTVPAATEGEPWY